MNQDDQAVVIRVREENELTRLRAAVRDYRTREDEWEAVKVERDRLILRLEDVEGEREKWRLQAEEAGGVMRTWKEQAER